MSVTIITYLHCDGCNEPWDNAPFPKRRGYRGENAYMQRKDAHKQGWRTFPEPLKGRGALDYCADCLSDKEAGFPR